MFREVALVTFTAGMLGTSAATFHNASVTGTPQRPPAVERPATAPDESKKPKPKAARDTVALRIP